MELIDSKFIPKTIFKNTTTSYKYLFFKSLIDIAFEQEKNNSEIISLKKICYKMIYTAWYPIQKFHLSFGSQDQIHIHISKLKIKFDENSNFKRDDPDEKDLIEFLNLNEDSSEVKNIFENLKRNVFFRFLTPYSENSIESFKNYEGIQNKDNLPYRFIENKEKIILNKEFIEFVKIHYNTILDFWKWNFSYYLQQKNPLTPGIILKIEKPKNRDLKIAKYYWKKILSYNSIQCIYSDEIISANSNFALDHFIPWSHLVHDQIWNLVPTFSKINSSKSDKLPSIEKYLDDFVKLQIDSAEKFLNPLVHKYNLSSEGFINQSKENTQEIRLKNIEVLIHNYDKSQILDKFNFKENEDNFLKEVLLDKKNAYKKLRDRIELDYRNANLSGFNTIWKYEK